MIGIMKNIFNKKGFTLLEVLVAMGIFLLLIVGVTSILMYSFRARDVIWEQLSTQNEGRKVLQDFTNELRSATASSVGAYAIEAVSTSSIIFYSNIDSDSLRERVRYFLSGTTLRKGVIKPTGTPMLYSVGNETVVDVAQDVNNCATSTFTYYGSDYNGVTVTSTLSSPINTTLIRAVGLYLRLEEKPNLSPTPFIAQGKVDLRNLKSN